MIILEKPYVSDFLIETIKKNNFKVLDNEISRNYFTKNKLISSQDTVNITKDELFYSNSENSIDWIAQNLNSSDLNKMIELSKDKFAFRNALKSIYPNYYFKEIKLNEIKNINPKELHYPFVLKPCVGFLSFGVYPVKNENEFIEVVKKIDNDIEKIKNIFPSSVVNMTNFLIEEMIEGDEYALDAYFDKDGNATILNIFQHPFFNDRDVSDRAYYTSKEIIEKYLDKFTEILNKIGKAGNYKNFPFHLELRANEKEIIPIEINPMRFCGWCITDIAQNAWGINVYEYYFNQQKPNWKEILKNSDDSIYYFTIGDIPSSINRKNIKEIDFEGYLKNISNPLEIRKIDYNVNPVFAIVFAKTNSLDEIKNILELDTTKYIKL